MRGAGGGRGKAVVLVDGGAKQKCEGDMGDKGECNGCGNKRLVCLWLWKAIG